MNTFCCEAHWKCLNEMILDNEHPQHYGLLKNIKTSNLIPLSYLGLQGAGLIIIKQNATSGTFLYGVCDNDIYRCVYFHLLYH